MDSQGRTTGGWRRALVTGALCLNALLLVLYFTIGPVVASMGHRGLWITWVFSGVIFIVPIASISAIVCLMRQRASGADTPPGSH